jgi:hypothetical protein
MYFLGSNQEYEPLYAFDIFRFLHFYFENNLFDMAVYKALPLELFVGDFPNNLCVYSTRNVFVQLE